MRVSSVSSGHRRATTLAAATLYIAPRPYTGVAAPDALDSSGLNEYGSDVLAVSLTGTNDYELADGSAGAMQHPFGLDYGRIDGDVVAVGIITLTGECSIGATGAFVAFEDLAIWVEYE